MKNQYFVNLILIFFLSLTALAQKGLPRQEDTKATVVTNYPTNLDFSASMLSKLKVPTGWKSLPLQQD